MAVGMMMVECEYSLRNCTQRSVIYSTTQALDHRKPIVG